MSQRQQRPAREQALHQTRSAGLGNRWTIPGVCVFLALIVWIVFGQTLRFDFTNFDDNVYVYNDPVVTGGLTLEGVKAAFSDQHSDNWVPLTTLSHMLDCQLYGLNAGDHHLTNVLLQTATAILLFLALREITGFLWRSAFVAAVFAIHPLRAESVAWVAERKDVLSGVFFMLTLWTYVRYVRSPKPMGWYLAMLFCFGLGLMSKPSVVTLPFVLLLLDYWSLNRMNTTTLRRIIVEKIPLFLLSLACCIPTVFAEKTDMMPLESYSLYFRIENAIVSYVIQMEHMVYPTNLAPFYPYPNAIPWWEVVLAGMLLAGICAIVWAQRRTRPWLLVGWLWYLGMLFPNIGLIQVGDYARADRYTYLPEIGLVLALTWLGADWCTPWRHRRVALASLSTVILVALIFCARIQAACWRNSETLWNRALACTSSNSIAHYNLGVELYRKGRMDEAISHYQEALQIEPDYAEARNNLGNALLQRGDVDDAISNYQKALQIKPDYAEACNNLGAVLLRKGQVDEAISDFKQALQIKPNLAEAYNDLGNALFQQRNLDGAISNYQKALQIKPDYADACNNLGLVLLQKGKPDEAILRFQEALRIDPDIALTQHNLGSALLQKGDLDQAIIHFQRAVQLDPGDAKFRGDLVITMNDLAWSLATSANANIRDGKRAVQLGERACELTEYKQTIFIGTLAAAYAEAGRFDDAVATAQKAIATAQRQEETNLVQRNQEFLQLYLAHKPYHEQNQ